MIILYGEYTSESSLKMQLVLLDQRSVSSWVVLGITVMIKLHAVLEMGHGFKKDLGPGLSKAYMAASFW